MIMLRDDVDKYFTYKNYNNDKNNDEYDNNDSNDNKGWSHKAPFSRLYLVKL